MINVVSTGVFCSPEPIVSRTGRGRSSSQSLEINIEIDIPAFCVIDLKIKYITQTSFYIIPKPVLTRGCHNLASECGGKTLIIEPEHIFIAMRSEFLGRKNIIHSVSCHRFNIQTTIEHTVITRVCQILRRQFWEILNVRVEKHLHITACCKIIGWKTQSRSIEVVVRCFRAGRE